MAGKTYQVKFVLAADGKGATRGIKSVGRELGKLNKTQTALNRNMAHSTSLMTGFAGAASGLAAIGLGKSILEANFAMESFNTLLTDNQMEYLVGITDKWGVSLQGSARSLSLLNAATADSGLEVAEVNRIYESLVITGRAFNLSAEDMRGVMRAVEQSFNKGNVQAEELRGQLSERLPGAFSLAAKAMGKTTQELGKMLDNGELLAVDLFPKLADVLINKYTPAAEEMAKKGAAAFERLRNSWFQFKAEVAEGGIAEGFISTTTAMAGGLDTLTDNIDEVKVAVGALTAILLGRALSAWAANEQGIVRVTMASIAKTKALKIELKTTLDLAKIEQREAIRAQKVAANKLLQVKIHYDLIKAKIGEAEASRLLSSALNAEATAYARVTTSQASGLAANAAMAASKGRLAAATATLFGLLGGWTTVAVAATYGVYVYIDSLDELTTASQNALDEFAKYATELNALDQPSVRAQQVTRELRQEIELLAKGGRNTGAWMQVFEDVLSSMGIPIRSNTQDIYAMRMALVKSTDEWNKGQQAMIEMIARNAEMGTAAENTATALKEVEDATKLATDAIRAEGEALRQSKEEKWKSALVTKVMKDNTKANIVEVRAAADAEWNLKTALDAANKSRKEQIKLFQDQLKFGADALKTTNKEISYLKLVISVGREAADSIRERSDAMINMTAGQRKAYLAAVDERDALQGVVDALEATTTASKTTASATTTLTSAVEEQLSAYEKLSTEIYALAIEGYDLQILEAQAKGHLDVAAAIEVEKAVVERLNAQKGNSILLTEDQIRNNEEYKRQQQTLADAVAASAERQQEIWENMVENVQKAWGDLFYGYMEKALMDGEFSFAEFRDNIWRMFIRLLADMAAKWLATSIFGGGIGAANAGLVGNFAAIAAGASNATAAIAQYATGAYAAAQGGAALASSTGATTTAMGALAPAAEAAEFAALQSGGAASTSALGFSSLGAAMAGAGIVAAGFALNAAASSSRMERLAEVTDEVNRKFLTATDVVNTASAAYGNFGADEMVVQLSEAELKAQGLATALASVADATRIGNEGTMLLTGNIEAARAVAAGYSAEAQGYLDLEIAKNQKLIEQSGQKDTAANNLFESTRRASEAWAEGIELINATSFQPIIDEVARMTDVTAADFKEMGADGVYTADEIAAGFGTSADAIIAAMGGASQISISDLLRILSVGDSTADGIAAAFNAAGVDMSGGMIDGVDRIQEAINALIGADVQSTHTIATIRRGGGADQSDSFASGTGGQFLTVPYDGYQPTFHEGEQFKVIPKHEVESGGSDNSETLTPLLEQLVSLMSQQVDYSEDTARSIQRAGLRGTSARSSA